MAFRSKAKVKQEPVVNVAKEKILDVDASMKGNLTFKDAVNLRINGKFEGTLDTKGNLTVGENAQVQANIVGESIEVCGKVFGDVTASNSLSLTRTAFLKGDIRTPRLSIAEGAVLQGKCEMPNQEVKVSRSTISEMFMTVDELAKYLEVDSASILDWAKKGRIPAQRESDGWRFDRTKVDAWIASERIK